MAKKSSHATWGGRFTAGPAELMLQFSESVSFDQRLAPFDIAGSKAHSAMLAKVGLITPQERDAIHAGLDEILARINAGKFAWDTKLEDVHMNIEQALTQRVPAAAKLHTARSRNDQVATDMRLFFKHACGVLAEKILGAQRALLGLADANRAVLIPGYTHLQRAQPVFLAHHLFAWLEMLGRDRGRLADVAAHANWCPLGAGAIAGTTLPIDREFTAKALGFVDHKGRAQVTQNSMDTVADRDLFIEFASACAVFGVHVSRMAEDLILWSSAEFKFIELPDAFCTGSSLMPQKKNPDSCELLRGKSARLQGNLHTLLTLAKGLPLTYNRDLQEDKPPVFDSFDQTALCADVLAGTLGGTTVYAERCAAAVADPALLATDLADYLVIKGVAFRDAHHAVGAVVRLAEKHAVALNQLPTEEVQRIHPAFEADWVTVFDLQQALAKRTGTGMPGPAQVARQFARWKKLLSSLTARLRGTMPAFFPTAKSDPELAPFRAGLVFGFFNALTWQIGIGTPMVLFAERLGATPFQVGLAYSFVFLLTPIQVAATALLPRFGFKRVSLGGWSARSIFLAIPVWLAVLAPEVGRPWMVSTLIWSIFFFCFFRSIGAAAMTTWFIGFLPPGVRGRYFATDQILSGIAGVGTLIACAALFAWLPIYTALLVQYVIALTGSTLSYYSLKRLPDIARPGAISLWSIVRDTPRHLFRPSPFRHYLWLAVWYTVITTPIPPFAAYYLKVGAQLTPGTIMLFEVLRYSGAIFGAWLLRRRIDLTGARPFFLVSLGLTALAAVGWVLYLRHIIDGMAAMFAIYFVVGLGWVCWTVANLNYLPKVAPAAERALFVSLHGAATFFIGGCAPLLWGLVLKATGPDGAPAIDADVFQLFFASVLVSACVLSVLVARLPEESKTPVEPIIIMNAIMNPFRAASYIATLIDLPSLRSGSAGAKAEPPRTDPKGNPERE